MSCHCGVPVCFWAYLICTLLLYISVSLLMGFFACFSSFTPHPTIFLISKLAFGVIWLFFLHECKSSHYGDATLYAAPLQDGIFRYHRGSLPSHSAKKKVNQLDWYGLWLIVCCLITPQKIQEMGLRDDHSQKFQQILFQCEGETGAWDRNGAAFEAWPTLQSSPCDCSLRHGAEVQALHSPPIAVCTQPSQ